MAHKYARIRTLGKGTFGVAHLVCEETSRALLVAKEIKIENRQDAEDAMVEARMMSKFDHINIVKFREVFRVSPKLITIVMEYCDDGDLADKIARRKMTHAYFHEEQFAQALHHLHSKGGIHRDIKTANLFLLSCGVLKLGDFGIAKILDRNAARMSARTTRTPVGTPMYMAPELCNGQPYTQKADMWSMGCVIYELCALRPAFVAQNMEMLLAKIRTGQHDRQMPPHYSQDLCGLIVSLLMVEADKRLSAAEVLRLGFLQTYIDQSPAVLFSKGQFFVPVLRDAEPAPPAQPPPEILVISDTMRKRETLVETVVELPRSRDPSPPGRTRPTANIISEKSPPKSPRMGGAASPAPSGQRIGSRGSSASSVQSTPAAPTGPADHPRMRRLSRDSLTPSVSSDGGGRDRAGSVHSFQRNSSDEGSEASPSDRVREPARRGSRGSLSPSVCSEDGAPRRARAFSGGQQLPPLNRNPSDQDLERQHSEGDVPSQRAARRFSLQPDVADARRKTPSRSKLVRGSSENDVHLPKI